VNRRPEGTAHDSAAIFSGGLDSTTLVYGMVEAGYTPHLISFNYGQRHSIELTYARLTAGKLNLRHDIIDLSGLTYLISNSALTSDVARHTKPMTAGDWADGKEAEWVSTPHIEVPEGHYAEDNMKATVVPNRNMIMLSIAAGIAVNNSYKVLATGVHAGDHFVYPDCRPQFINAANDAIVLGNLGFGPFTDQVSDMREDLVDFLSAPYINKSKADIAYEALQLKVPLEDTWSCYKGGDKHCGKCGTCVERLEAIHDATEKCNEDHGVGVLDPHFTTFDKTQYEDSVFWKTAVAK
jgi:7-cyano-7-deazaguanine synthase